MIQREIITSKNPSRHGQTFINRIQPQIRYKTQNTHKQPLHTKQKISTNVLHKNQMKEIFHYTNKQVNLKEKQKQDPCYNLTPLHQTKPNEHTKSKSKTIKNDNFHTIDSSFTSSWIDYI